MDQFNHPMAFPGHHPTFPTAPKDTKNSTLYVGNLDKDIDQQMLYDYFSAVVKPEAIASVNLKKDVLNMGESRGFAFITFHSQADATRAKNALNHSKIKENQITISFMRDRNEAVDAKANLFFKKLNKEMTSKELEDLCAPYGTILSCKLRFDSQGHSLGYGYVQFEKEQAANDCIEALNGTNVKESIIEVQKFSPAAKRGTINQKCNVYVKDFPANWNEKQVTEFIEKEFTQGGKAKITSKCVAKDTKLGKFYAFVAFETPEKAKEAIDALKDREFPGEANKLYVDYAMTKEERRKKLRDQHQRTKNETNLYIKSLAKDVTEDRLQKAFEKFGIVTSVAIKTHELNRSTAPPGSEKKILRFGFINFQNATDATRALANGKVDAEVKALIDPTHYPNVEFLCLHQAKGLRYHYNKMEQKNKKSSQNYEKQLNLLRQMWSQMSRANTGQNRSNKGQRGGFDGAQQGGKRAGMDAMQMMNPAAFATMYSAMGPMMNPMMMQQQPFANPQMQQMMMNPALNPVMNPALFAMPQGVIAPTPMPFQQPIHTQVAPSLILEKDVNWLKNNLAEFDRMSQDDKKTILGNLMYKKVNELSPPAKLIPKITGMLIDLEVLEIKEVIEILENKEILKDRMSEAISIIESDAN